MSEAIFFHDLLLVSGTVAFIASLGFLRRFLEVGNERCIPIAMDGLRERLRMGTPSVIPDSDTRQAR